MSAHRVSSFAALATIAFLSACAGSQAWSPELAPASRHARSMYLVTATEIEETGEPDALAALRRARPALLERRVNPVTSSYGGAPALYVDRVYNGNLDLLATLPARRVVEIRYLTGVSGQYEMGKFYPGGIIAVTTRR